MGTISRSSLLDTAPPSLVVQCTSQPGFRAQAPLCSPPPPPPPSVVQGALSECLHFRTMLRPKKNQSPPRAEDGEMKAKLAKAKQRQQQEKVQRRQEMEEKRPKYPEDEEEEAEEKKAKEAAEDGPRLTRNILIGNAVIGIFFSSLPYSEGDEKGALLMLVLNAVWTLAIHSSYWLDYAVLVGFNILLAVHSERIIRDAHLVPGLMPPEQWAMLIGSNGSIILGYWWKFIRKAPKDEKETHWNIVTLIVFALDCAMGVYMEVISMQHLMFVVGRLKNFLTTGAM